MHSRLPAGLIAITAALLALIISGCGSSTATIDPVAEAAVATSHAGGAQMSMRIRVEIEGLASPLTMTGTGNFNFAVNEGELVSNMTGLPASGLAGIHVSSLHFTELFAKDVLYLESPLFNGKLPGGARWMKLDLGKATPGIGLDPQSLSSGQSNPAQILDYLRAGGGSVKNLGSDMVRGTKTTHYGGTIDLIKAAGKIPGANSSLLKSSTEKLVAHGGSAEIPVEVWVDDHNLLRRMTMNLSEAPEGHHFAAAIAIELFNFGATPSVNPPSGDEVFDATQSSLAGLAGGG
jgi:hypothetical protein